jgi:hypothetical protein
MADFDQSREQLRASRARRDQALDAIAASQERLKRIAASQSELDRAFNENNQAAIAERNRLAREKEDEKAKLNQFRNGRDSAIAAEAAAIEDWVLFTDPRHGIERLKDDTPILLMPVRLETRFKSVAAAGAPAAVPQLWVRIYPDDCWIDSFDATLTETEVTNAKTYWASIWAAGGIEDQQRGAWRALANSHGSGRAAWIVQQFRPVNIAAEPKKQPDRPQDVILAIPTETALADNEAGWISDYWKAVWIADGDGEKTATAQAVLEGHVGAARAAELIAQYQPTNFDAPLAPGFEKPDVRVSVAFVIFPAIDTKQNAWARAPKMTVLPDRFVFLGYTGTTLAVVELGNPVPSPLYTGPDPSAPKAEQLQNDDQGDIQVPDQLKWLSDFDRAVQDGMGFRVNLTRDQAVRGFDRVLVVGLRLNADPQAAQGELETLLRHHANSRTGLAVVPQGTPTNNTEAVGAGHSRVDDPDQSFDDLKAPLFTTTSSWLDKKDGQWIAEFLGVDPAIFVNAHAANSTDQIVARAMNTALWPATLGYWMETMMSPVFSSDAVERTRDFFGQYIIAGGAVPTMRIGNQPYGLLPATAISRMGWLNPRDIPGIDHGVPDPTLPFLRQLYQVLKAIDDDWRAIVPQISYTGKRDGDPHQTLLDIVGLHPGSVEWAQRYAESLRTLYNRLAMLGFGGFIQAIILAAERAASRGLLTHLGYTAAGDPSILEKVFSGAFNQLTGGVVDDQPLSETKSIRAYTTAGDNYIKWLIDAARISLDALYQQDGFKDDKPPASLLFLWLRHALQLGYHDVSVRLHESSGLYTQEMAVRARSDYPFLHVQNNTAVSESRYQPLFAVVPQITGNPTQTVSQFISANLFLPTFEFYLPRQLAALDRLQNETTARLERAFADHMDLGAYRLDAWLLGIVNYQLSLMRGIRDGGEAQPRQGIYLGGYAWLEDVRPENKVLTPVQLGDPELVADFARPTDPPLMRDSTNEGYIHAPSLNHAVTAAVLRNGFISDASPQNRQTMAVNLTSERVRVALGLIEGIRAGQSLSDLLGYQFERGLHDRYNQAHVDEFIYKLRKAFPIRADRLNSTKSEEGVAIEAIEARNVIDGLALAEHIKATGQKTYPFGKSGLPDPPLQSQKDAINAEADRLLQSYDAVADLALSEGVYQAILGNYDRVASTYDAYARGNFPPEPDVIRTPFAGAGLTHRVTLHLEAGADHTISPIPGVAMTPRAQAEPALNNWLAAVMPALDRVGCVVSFRPTGAAGPTEGINLRQLGLQPADLLAIIGDDMRQDMTELDDRILRHAVANFAPRPDVPVEIRYMETKGADFSVFEAMPLLRQLRTLATKSRPLRATDLTLMNESRAKQDTQPFADPNRFRDVRVALQTLRNNLAAFQPQLEGPLSDLTNRRGEILAHADDYVNDLVPLLMGAATFAILQAGWGFAFDFKRRTYSAILTQASGLVSRWNDKLTEFDALIVKAGAAATDEDKFDLLAQAERAISTIATTPLPATPAIYEANLTGVKRPAFAAKRDQFDAVQNTTRTAVTLLLSDVAALLPITDFDIVEFSLTPREDEMVLFAQDALNILKTVLAEIDRRLKASKDLLDQYAGAASAADQVQALEETAKALLGADFRIIPEFAITAAQGDEFENALNASRSGDLFQFLTNPPDPATPPLDFPVDTWLYGIARVREKVKAWEQMLMFAGALGKPEPALDAMQLPFTPGERWFALEFPPSQPLNKDHLLYTAHFAAPFNKATGQCGLLLDEWVEIVPGSSADTGIAFHFDRPNCEAPQSMLLVTPTDFRGAWQWNDLVDALNETLDLAKRRAIEPKHIDATPYAPFLPATITASQVFQLTISLNMALNNNVATLISRS